MRPAALVVPALLLAYGCGSDPVEATGAGTTPEPVECEDGPGYRDESIVPGHLGGVAAVLLDTDGAPVDEGVLVQVCGVNVGANLCVNGKVGVSGAVSVPTDYDFPKPGLRERHHASERHAVACRPAAPRRFDLAPQGGADCGPGCCGTAVALSTLMANVEDTPAESVRVEPAVTATPVTSVGSEAPSNLRWGAIVGGTVAAIGIASLLYSLGLALGLSSIDPGDPGSLKPSGIFTGVWALVVSLVALFAGGFVAARGASALTRMAGALHGLVMWGLTVVAGMWLIGTVISGLASGAAAVGRTAADVVRQGAPALPQLTQQLDLGMDDALGPINERLRAEGKPEVTPQQLQAATKDIAQGGLRRGQVDRQELVKSITANTALEPDDANELATRIEGRYRETQGEVRRELAEAGRDAMVVAEDTGKAFWGVFGALLFGMIAAIGGALVGSSTGGRKRPQVVRERPLPRAGHREAYP